MTRLAERRKKLRMTQIQVANQAKITERTYRLHETRKAEGGCRVSVQRKIARVLGLKVETLFDADGRAR